VATGLPVLPSFFAVLPSLSPPFFPFFLPPPPFFLPSSSPFPSLPPPPFSLPPLPPFFFSLSPPFSSFFSPLSSSLLFSFLLLPPSSLPL
ncbi:hypothetical protein ACXWRW_10275, partial [Streptococcus pyogenes]